MIGTLIVEDAWRPVTQRAARYSRPARGEIRLRLRAAGWTRPDCTIGVHALEDGAVLFLQVDDDRAVGFATQSTGDAALDAEIVMQVRRFVRTARNVAAIRQTA